MLTGFPYWIYIEVFIVIWGLEYVYQALPSKRPILLHWFSPDIVKPKLFPTKTVKLLHQKKGTEELGKASGKGIVCIKKEEETIQAKNNIYTKLKPLQ